MREKKQNSRHNNRRRGVDEIQHFMLFLFNHLFVDDEDDLQELHDGAFLGILAHFALRKAPPRSGYFVRERMEWDYHLEQLHRESPGSFDRLYRMSLSSFRKLCLLIDPFVQVVEIKSNNRTGKKSIGSEVVLHCLLRWLAGGSYLDIRLSAGISRPSVYVCIHKAVDAILRCGALKINFPVTKDEIDKSASDFQQLSSDGIIDGCVACVDGLLLPIKIPSKKETGNVLAYFSGHYNTYGINVQAACDSSCRFFYVALAAPGRSSDVVAFQKTSLSKLVESLPLGRYVLGDNAYVCTEHVLTPFPGMQRIEPQNDIYNFYLSQLRIRIEMTFGRFMNRWCVFQRPIGLKLKNTGRVFMCAARLHNFCEDEREGAELEEEEQDDGSNTTVLHPTGGPDNVPGNSIMRDLLVDQIFHSGLSRPGRNLRRNKVN